jgi:hypothetical protein
MDVLVSDIPDPWPDSKSDKQNTRQTLTTRRVSRAFVDLQFDKEMILK